MTKKARITTIILVIIFVLLGAGTIIAINMKPEAPIAEVEMARQALALARNQKAETFAKETFVKAQQLYDSAMIVWNNENEKFFLKTNIFNACSRRFHIGWNMKRDWIVMDVTMVPVRMWGAGQKVLI